MLIMQMLTIIQEPFLSLCLLSALSFLYSTGWA